MAVTIRDIARQLGVAPSTVSRALRGEGRISAALQARIRVLARELGYTPNTRILNGFRAGRRSKGCG